MIPTLKTVATMKAIQKIDTVCIQFVPRSVHGGILTDHSLQVYYLFYVYLIFVYYFHSKKVYHVLSTPVLVVWDAGLNECSPF